MTTLVPTRYALDLTGTSIDNKVMGEFHSPPMKNNRSITPFYGPFFTDSLKVTNSVTNALLVRGVQYNVMDIVGLPSAQSGKEICTVILLTDKTVPSVRIEYNTVGGRYEKSYEAIRLLIETLSADDRPITWPNISGMLDAYDPTMHLHKAGDVIGFEYAVVALERLKNTISLGDDVSHHEILRQIDILTATLNTLGTAINGTGANIALANAAKATTDAQAALAVANTLNAKIDTLTAATATILANLT